MLIQSSGIGIGTKPGAGKLDSGFHPSEMGEMRSGRTTVGDRY